MSKLFISHSSANNAAALAIASWLADAGWTEYFLDITPTRGLAPGERWQEALKTAADRCEAVLFLISPAWQASRWCLAEFLLAKQIGKTIFGILVEATPLDALPKEVTSEWQLCDLVAGSARKVFRVSQPPVVPETEVSFAEDGLARLRIGLQRAGLDPSSFAWPPPGDPNRPPYRGLKPLEAEDAAIFFGRESAVVRGLDALRGLRERGVERLFVILGASGAGKSSYLRAGLWPRLMRDDANFLPLPVIRPERAVISGGAGLLASLETAFRDRKAGRSRAAINEALQAPGGLDRIFAELQTLARLRIGPDAPPPLVVVCIDQAEELFAVEGAAESARFLDVLAQALTAPAVVVADGSMAQQRALAIVGIRSDSYERLQTEPRLAPLAPYLLSLPPIARAEYKSIVEGPARRHAEAGHELAIDPALTERLVEETEGADAVPLLAFTLERLFVEHGGDGKLLLQDYEASGGVRGSIEAAIEAAFVEPGLGPIVPVDRETRERLLRSGFIPWLARVDPHTEERKRRVARWEEIPQEVQPLLERLIEQRLLVRDRRRLEGHEDAIVVEVAHEALLRQWPTLTRWLDEDAQSLKILDTVQRAADDWMKHRDAQEAGDAWLLHTGERLAAAETLRLRPDFDRLLGVDGCSYLAACRGRDDQEEQERKQRVEAERIARERELEQARALAEEQRRRADEQAAARIRQRRLSWLIGIAAVAAAGMAAYALQQRNEAAQQLDHANEALALGIWSDLDPPGDAPLDRQYRNALWRLARERAGVRDAFIKHLVEDETNQLRFGAMAAPIVRSLGFDRPGANESDKIIAAIVKAIPVTNDLDQVNTLAQSASVLAGNLTSTQALRAVEAVLVSIKATKEAGRVRALARALPAIAGRLGADNVQSALRVVLSANRDTALEYYQGRALAEAVPPVAARLTVDQVEAAIGPVFSAFRENDDADQLRALAQAMQLIAAKLSSEQAQGVLGEMLDMLRDMPAGATKVDFFVKVAPSLVERLTPDAALALLPAALPAFRNGYATDASASQERAMQGLAAKLAPERAAAAQGPIIDAMLSTGDPFEIPVLATMLRTLHATLAPERGQAMSASILERMQRARQEPHAMRALAQALRALPVPLVSERGQAALEPILESFATTKNPWDLRVLAQAMGATSAALAAEQGQTALDKIVAMLEASKDPRELPVLIEAMSFIPATLAPEQGQAVLQQLLDAIKTTEDPAAVQMLVQSVQALRVTPPKEQAVIVLGRVLKEIVDATDDDGLRALLQSVPTFAAHLTPDEALEAVVEFMAAESLKDASTLKAQVMAQAARALAENTSPESVRAIVEQWLPRNRDEAMQRCRSRSLSRVMQVLADRLTPVEVGGVLPALIGCVATIQGPPARRDLAATVSALATKLTAEQALDALVPVQSSLAWAGSDDEAAAWANAFAELLLRSAGPDRVGKLVEVLKYSMTGGSATQVLLDALQRIDPNAPGRDAGLDANLQWLRRSYPALNLDAAPVCPEPPSSQGLSCPKDA